MPSSSKREAKIAITADAAGVKRGTRDAERTLRTFQRNQEKAAKAAEREAARAQKKLMAAVGGGINKGGGGFIGAAVGGLAGAAGFGLSSAIGDAAHDVFDFERELTRFGIDAQLSGEKMAQFRNEVTATSNKLGQSRNAVLQGAHAYQILTGDAEGAIKASALFAEVANASGASMDDIAAVAASFKENAKLDPSDFRKGFDVLLNLGHKGSVELRGIAAQMPGLMPMFAQFGAGGGLKGLAEMGSALQVIRHGFGDDAEAATGLKSLMTGIERNSARLEAAGVKVFDVDPKTGKRTARDFIAILDDIKKHKLDLKDLIKDLGRLEGARAALEAVTESGNEEMHQLLSGALDSNQVAKDNAQYMNSTTGQMALAWEHMKNAIAEALSPDRIAAFADVLKTLVGFLGDTARLLDHVLGHDVKERTAMGEDKYVQQALGGDQQGAIDAAIADTVTDPKKLVAERGMQGAMDAAKNAMDPTRSAAAEKYLEDMGYERGPLGIAGWVQKTKTSAGPNTGNAQVNALLAQMQAMTVMVGELSKRPINLHIDGNKVAVAVADAPVNRLKGGPSGR